jgi:thioredoxin 1
MMLGNLIAVVRWPFSLFYRVARINRSEGLGEPVHANEKRLLELFKQELPVVVDFWAEWCGPCLLMNGVLSEFAESEASRVIVAKVDATLHPKMTSKHNVGGLPTILLFRRGQETGRHVGLMSVGQLREFVDEWLEWQIKVEFRAKWASQARSLPTNFTTPQGDWVLLDDNRCGDVEPALFLADGLHAKWVQLLESMTPEEFVRTFHHPQSGETVSLWTALNYYPWHAQHHTAQILWLREQHGW